LARELDEGEWTYSLYFTLVDAAKDWGRTPSEFGLCNPEDDPSVMAAYTKTVATMRAWEHQEQEREAERKRATGSKPGRRKR
jgi:hypothetical protein